MIITSKHTHTIKRRVLTGSLAAFALFLCRTSAFAVVHPVIVEDSIATTSVSLTISFPINEHTVHTDFSDNRLMLDSVTSVMSRAAFDSLFTIRSIEVTGTASPDGHLNRNLELATRRMLAVCDWINRNATPPAGVEITPKESYVAWNGLRRLVAESDISCREEILRILSLGSDNSTADTRLRMSKLKRLKNGRIWPLLARDIFPQLRHAVVLTLTTETFERPAAAVPGRASIVDTVPSPQEPPVLPPPVLIHLIIS